MDALDLNAERLELHDTMAEWRAAGLERERQVLVARQDGVAVAAIVLELGPPATNLFGLMDTARLFPLAPEGTAAFVPLLDAAREWYAQRGRTTFVLVREDGEAAAEWATRARLQDSPDSRPHLWLLSARMMPEFLEYVSEATVGRLIPENRTA